MLILDSVVCSLSSLFCAFLWIKKIINDIIFTRTQSSNNNDCALCCKLSFIFWTIGVFFLNRMCICVSHWHTFRMFHSKQLVTPLPLFRFDMCTGWGWNVKCLCVCVCVNPSDAMLHWRFMVTKIWTRPIGVPSLRSRHTSKQHIHFTQIYNDVQYIVN